MGRPKLSYSPYRDEPLYKRWKGMKERCYSEFSISYKNYGARGIKVAEEWLGADGLKKFTEYIGLPPTKNHTVERIDNDGNYEPGNVRWATKSEQQHNKRLLQTNNSSGYKGVSRSGNKYRASIMVEKRPIVVYGFETKFEAAKAYDAMARELFGKNAKLNFP